MKRLIAASVAALCAASASADSTYSVELNKTSYEDNTLEAQSNALSVVYRNSLNDNFSVNAKFGLGVFDDNVDGLATDADFSIDYLAGVYVQYDLMPSSDFNVFGTLGYTQTELSVKSSLGDFSETESGLSYGIGAEYQLNEDFSVYLEAAKLIDDEPIELSSYNIGFEFNF